MARVGRWSTFAALCLALSTGACGKVREIRECRALSREIATVMDQVEPLAKSKDAASTRRIAAHYGALAKALSPRAAGTSALAGAVRDYAALIQATHVALEAHAAAVESGNPTRINETRRELERVVKRERALITRLSAECRV